MKEFRFKGTLNLENVDFTVRAETVEGALARVANGDFDAYDIDAAHSVRTRIAASSVKEVG